MLRVYLKIAYQNAYRLGCLIIALWHLAGPGDPSTVVFWITLLVAVLPEAKFTFTRVFSKQPLQSERSPVMMLLFALLMMLQLSLADTGYLHIEISAAVILGYVLLINWAVNVEYHDPVDDSVSLPEDLVEYRYLYICLGAHNPFDWPLYRYCSRVDRNIALLCRRRGDWVADWVFDGKPIQQFIRDIGCESSPAGGFCAVEIERGRIKRVIRLESLRSKVLID